MIEGKTKAERGEITIKKIKKMIVIKMMIKKNKLF
jgi:hypothetical protein